MAELGVVVGDRSSGGGASPVAELGVAVGGMSGGEDSPVAGLEVVIADRSGSGAGAGKLPGIGGMLGIVDGIGTDVGNVTAEFKITNEKVNKYQTELMKSGTESKCKPILVSKW